MGERDLTAAAVAGPPRRFTRRLLAPLALLALLAALVMARPLEAPPSPRAAAHCLAAASLARDLDLSFAAADRPRAEAYLERGSRGVLLARSAEPSTASYPVDLWSQAYLAPFARLGGLRGVVLAHVLALVVAMGLAARTLRQRLDAPWRLLLACVFASATLALALTPRSEVLVLAAVVAAFALAYRSEVPTFDELPEVWADRSRGMGAGLRWLLVGFLLGYAALTHPVHLLLLLPAGLAARDARPGGGPVMVVLGAVGAAALGISGALLLGGAWPWGPELSVFTARSGFPGQGGEWESGDAVPSLLAAARPVPDLSLSAWNLLFAAVGRTAGALPYFLPIVLLLALWEPRRRRSPLVVAAALAVVAALVVWPFDWAGDAPLGNAALLPVFGALWLVPTRRCGWLAVAAITAAAAPFLWPSWLDAAGLSGRGSTVGPAAERWLPHESTRRPLAGDFAALGTLRVLPAGGAVEYRGDRFLIDGGRWGSLVVASPVPLATLYLDFDGQAGSELEVVGGRLGDTLFRGDGGVRFSVELPERPRRHPMWFSAEPQSLYDLRLRLPKAPRIPVAFVPGGDP